MLIAIFEKETVSLYIGQGFVSTSDGNEFLAKTDNVVGDDRRYLGGHGTVHPDSVVSRDGRVYYFDMHKGAIIRRSQDGLTRISDYGFKGLVGKIAAVHRPLYASSQSRVVAGWNAQYGCYVISFKDLSGSNAYDLTLWFHEESNGWVAMSSLMPELYGLFLEKMVALQPSNGKFWYETPEANYNNFFGTQYNRTVEFEIGQDSVEKIWSSVELDQEELYTTAGSNEDILSLRHTAGGTVQTKVNYADFKSRGSAWRSSIYRTLLDSDYQSQAASKYKSPHSVRGQSAHFTLVSNSTARNILKSVTISYIPSLLTYP